jgi:trk system potassium uptake protein TrkH
MAALASAHLPEIALSLLAAGQVVILAQIWARTREFGELITLFYERPAHLVLVSFLLLIGLGTLFLTFPAAAAGPRPIAPIDALFTATSAACVTGLVVLDTGTAFSTFGQAVIVCLIQLGGLNIMVLSAFAAILLGRGLGFRGQGALGAVLDVAPGSSARRLVLFIVAGTLVIESVGALLLCGHYALAGQGLGTGLWLGVFHSIAAFCNAGFSLHSDNLVGMNRAPFPLFVVAALITLGGLGFYVLASLALRSGRARNRSAVIQTRLVLIASALLVFVGAAGYAASEWNHTLDGLPPVHRLTNAAFQSVTLRTAGFNTVTFDDLRPETALMMMGWMFIGASPGGTGGGIKTTTAFVLIGSVLAILARRERVVLYRHRIALDTVYRSAAIAVIASLIVFAGAFALFLTQARMPFEWLLFECFSAFGTVGLTLGATARLDVAGKLIVAALMLAGRVGPLTLALLLGRRMPTRLGYPEARVMVG